MKKILIVVFVFFLLSALFYWFQIRPAKIRSFCLDWVPKNVTDSGGNQIQGNEAWNKAYRLCLVNKGMKPENLFNEN